MRYLIYFLIILSTTSVFSQESVVLSDNQLNVNLAPISISYERKIDSNKSFTVSSGIGYGFYFSASSSGGTESFFISAPFATGSVRNYYTRKRVKKDNLQNNSGNYIGLFSSYTFEAFGSPSSANELEAYLKTSKVFTLGPVWGIERNYASGIHLGISIGPGFKSGEYIESDFTFVGEFEFGFVLNSK